MLNKSDIKLINSLTKKKYRKLNKLFVIEGARLVREAVMSDFIINKIYITDDFISKPHHNKLMDQIAEKSIITNIVTEKEMYSICDTVTPAGILALCEIKEIANIDFNKSENWLYLDEIQDPGNLGTLLRSADWFGITNIALSENCIDTYNPKVLRGGMGAHFRLSIHEDISLSNFNDTPHTIIGAFQDGENIYNLPKEMIFPWVLIIGNEAHGITNTTVEHINKKIAIPRIGLGESLNAAVAGSILLYHLTKPS